MPVEHKLRLLTFPKAIPAQLFHRLGASTIRSISLVLAGAAVLSWAAILNGYPFLYYDSGAYIFTSLRLQVGPDRPIVYGLFIHFTRLYHSLWVVVMAQALVTSYLLLRTTSLILPARLRDKRWLALAVLTLTALTTSAPQFVGYVMPDVFASWLFLGGALFVFSGSKVDRLAGFAVTLVGMLVHNSHAPLALMSLIIFLIVLWLARRAPPDIVNRARQLLLLACLTPLLSSVIHARYGAEFLPSRGLPTFLVSQLAAFGVLSDVLDENCPVMHWKMCQYRDVIAENQTRPGWFLWNPESPISRVGWEQMGGEQSEIVQLGLKCCLITILRASLQHSWSQFWEVRSIRDLPVFDANNATFMQISRNYPDEFAEFMASRQQTPGAVINHALPIGEDLMNRVSFSATTCLAVVLALHGRHRLSAWLLAPVVFAVINAVIMGSTSEVLGRYQGRIVWLIPYFLWVVVVLLLWERLEGFRSSGGEKEIPTPRGQEFTGGLA
jgi:hypothetical protein